MKYFFWQLIIESNMRLIQIQTAYFSIKCYFSELSVFNKEHDVLSADISIKIIVVLPRNQTECNLEVRLFFS